VGVEEEFEVEVGEEEPAGGSGEVEGRDDLLEINFYLQEIIFNFDFNDSVVRSSL
jgi:hypothetical protein